MFSLLFQVSYCSVNEYYYIIKDSTDHTNFGCYISKELKDKIDISIEYENEEYPLEYKVRNEEYICSDGLNLSRYDYYDTDLEIIKNDLKINFICRDSNKSFKKELKSEARDKIIAGKEYFLYYVESYYLLNNFRKIIVLHGDTDNLSDRITLESLRINAWVREYTDAINMKYEYSEEFLMESKIDIKFLKEISLKVLEINDIVRPDEKIMINNSSNDDNSINYGEKEFREDNQFDTKEDNLMETKAVACDNMNNNAIMIAIGVFICSILLGNILRIF